MKKNLNFMDEIRKLNMQKNGFKFNEVVKMTIKSDSTQSNICYYIKFRVPIMHREFLK